MDPLGVDLSCRMHWQKFYDLDNIYSPGLMEEEFLGLFVKCDSCVFITTHKRFEKHYCRPKTADDASGTSD